ncbi:hemin-degrading factor [Actibacterium sp. D379-3]
MAQPAPLSADQIRQARIDSPKTRDRDLADQLGISEAELVVAQVGRGATRIDANPDKLLPLARELGEVMALTRNISAVHEKVGLYDNYHSGEHAAMILNEEIDLRLFPKHWVFGFAIETETGVRRTLQVFDAAGDAVHKIFLRAGSDHEAWARVVAALALPDQSDRIEVAARAPAEPARINPEKVETLRQEWAAMTDTHQFNRLAAKLKMNRLGAYRSVGAPFVRPLAPDAVDRLMTRLQETGVEVILFVGNKGCIQIHWGPLQTLTPMGPWLNVMDPRFNLHLRGDHIAEVWAVEKPTKRGPALSVEAFDSEGGLILQIFGRRFDEGDNFDRWADLVAALPALHVVEEA